MCFNKEVSLTTYIIGMIGAFILYQKKYIPEALFYGWVIQMQLIEYFLWKNQPCDKTNNLNNKDNISTTKYGILVNHLEPVVLWIAVIFLSKKILPMRVNYFMILFIIITILYTINALKNIECTTITDQSKPHLHWKWNREKLSGIYYGIFLLALVLVSYYGLEKGKINALIVFISFMVSYYIYGDKHSVGAMWCFMAAFVPWVLLFLYKYF